MGLPDGMPWQGTTSTMTAENIVQYVDGIIETSRAGELQGSSQPLSEFDKARITSSLGKLLYYGLEANAAATNKLTVALGQASADLQAASAASGLAASRLVWLTLVLAIATVSLVAVGFFQGWQSMRQANVAEKQLQTARSTDPTPQDPSLPASVKPTTADKQK